MLRLRLKKLKHRKYVIEELVTTEEQYCKSLSLILTEVKVPALEKKLLNKEESNQIFSVLDEIQNFHKFFSEKLRKSFENFNSRQSKFGDIILKVLPVFKMYFLYCDNFKNANNRLEHMRKENHPFITFIKPLEYNPSLQNLDLISQLVKPVQRLPKYVLLFKDLKKNTDEKHPDYQDIVKCLEEFAKINQLNNEKVTDHLKTRKILELDKKFGTIGKGIVKEARVFLEEEPLNILHDDMPRPVICYFLSDLILIVDESQNQLLKYIELDKNTKVKVLPDTKYFKWLFSVTSKESVTFLSDSLENKNKLVQFLTNTLNDIKDKAMNRDKAKETSFYSIGEFTKIQNKSFNFNLTVIGTMKRGIQHFRPVTMYIVQMQYGNILNKMYLRFSEMAKLNEMITKQFPDIKIENLPKKHWWRAQKTKIIESRKLLIENFLNSIFFHQELNQNLKILAFVGLAEKNISVFSEEFIEKNLEKNKRICIDLLEKEKFLGKSSIFSYLLHNTEYSSLTKGSFLFLSELQGSEESQNITIKLCNDEIVTIEINKYTKSIEACFEIARKLGLKSHLDFKLFLSNDEDERIIENEEFLCQVLDSDPHKINKDFLKEIMEKERKKTIADKIKEGIYEQINKVKKNWDDMCFCKYELIYKKSMFFANEIEKKDLKKDQIRLNLVAAQLLKEALHSKYRLSFEEYSMIAAVNCYIKTGNFEENYQKDEGFLEKFREFIPSLVIYLKTKGFWIDKVAFYWRKFTEEINEIHQLNHNYNDSKRNSRKKIENLRNIAEFTCFNFFKNFENFGSKFFWVTLKKNPERIKRKIDNFLWIALSYKAIILLSAEEKEEILKIENEKISSICNFPNSFSFVYEEEEFSFYSNESYEICCLIQEYLKVAVEGKNELQRLKKI